MLEKTKEILEIICNDDLFKNFDIRFVGGTALSYRINHRLSEDLDFATLKLSPKEISNMIFKYGGKIIDHDKTMEDYVSNDGADINYSYMKFLWMQKRNHSKTEHCYDLDYVFSFHLVILFDIQ